ncbi:MAG: cytochrome P450 family protein [Terriglobales bacterium]
MSAPPEIDLTDPQFIIDPYPIYARLREQAPVGRVRAGFFGRAWLITRYDDVAAALRDERFTKDFRKVGRPEAQLLRMFGPLNRHMLNVDQPDHTRLRALVQKAFTARFVEDLRPRIESLTEQFLDRLAGQRDMDVVRDYAQPLPTTVIAEILGVPVEDRERFQRWSADLVDFSGPLSLLKAFPGAWALWRYIRGLVKLRRERPEKDLMSALVAAEEAGDRLNEDELLAMVGILLLAGFETTVNLIGNGTLALLENPGEMERLRSQPALMPAAVEELLRYDSPIKLATPRWTLSEVTVAGVRIPKNAGLAVAIASANRDPQQFEQPDALHLAREPNRHLSLGQGIHYCLGAPLARLEGQIAFTTLLRRFPRMRLTVPRNALRWRNSMPLRGLESLPVSLG